MLELLEANADQWRRSPIIRPDYRRGVAPAFAGRKLPAEPLNPREVDAILAACGKGKCGTRNRALLVVMWRSALRVSEALALRPSDVDLDDGSIRVLHGKGDKDRTVGFDQTAGAVLQKWLDMRRTLGLPRNGPIFCTLSGPAVGEKAVYTSYVRNLCKRLAEKAGIDKRVHPHGFRHTCARDLRREGMPLEVISAQLGHRHLATTQQYLGRIAPETVVNEMGSREWPVAA